MPKSTILILEENYFDKKEQKISLRFDEDLEKKDYKEAFVFELEVSSTKNSTLVPSKIEISPTQPKILTVFLNLEETVENKKLYISPKNDLQVLKSKDKEKTYHKYPITSIINFFTTAADAAIGGIG